MSPCANDLQYCATTPVFWPERAGRAWHVHPAAGKQRGSLDRTRPARVKLLAALAHPRRRRRLPARSPRLDSGAPPSVGVGAAAWQDARRRGRLYRRLAPGVPPGGAPPRLRRRRRLLLRGLPQRHARLVSEPRGEGGGRARGRRRPGREGRGAARLFGGRVVGSQAASGGRHRARVARCLSPFAIMQAGACAMAQHCRS